MTPCKIQWATRAKFNSEEKVPALRYIWRKDSSIRLQDNLHTSALLLRWDHNCVGVGRQIYCKLTSIARKYTQEAHSSLRFCYIALLFISAGNRRERLKVVKAMNIHEYTEIFLNNHSFSTFDTTHSLTRYFCSCLFLLVFPSLVCCAVSLLHADPEHQWPGPPVLLGRLHGGHQRSSCRSEVCAYVRTHICTCICAYVHTYVHVYVRTYRCF